MPAPSNRRADRAGRQERHDPPDTAAAGPLAASGDWAGACSPPSIWSPDDGTEANGLPPEESLGADGACPLTAGVTTVLRPGCTLAAMAANIPAAATPATPIHRVIRETRFRP
jgi:hypothetical protein